MSRAVGITNANDGSNRLFVIEQTGEIRVVRNGVIAPLPYLTLGSLSQCRETPGSPLVNTGFRLGQEQGLLGLAFHPRFENNGLFFVHYSDGIGDSLVARFTIATRTADVLSAADRQTCLVVLRVDQSGLHNGGNIVFGPDGFMYIGLGDAAASSTCDFSQALDPAALAVACMSGTDFTSPGNGQPDRAATTRALLGKMLRIDVNSARSVGTNGLCGARPGGTANYAIPPGNPFAGADPQNGCDEVWAYGFRNPWRWSFDRATGDLIVGDVGQSTWEEVSLFPAKTGGGRAANGDRRQCEGRHLTNSCTLPCPNSQAAEVIVAHNNWGCNSTAISGVAVTGG